MSTRAKKQTKTATQSDLMEKTNSKKAEFNFCKTCGNILLSKPRTNTFYCKVCQEEFAPESPDDLKLYRKAASSKTSLKKKQYQLHKTIIIENAPPKRKGTGITEEEREAYEDLFEAGEYDDSS